jgi:hypothetical protein
VLLVLAPSALADGVDTGSARAIGRAGAALVGDDGGTALLANPGGLVRRDGWRAQLAVGLHDHDLRFRPAEQNSASDGMVPVIEDHGAALAAPELAVQGPLGPVVVGVAYLEPGELVRDLPAPLPDIDTPAVATRFPHRYAGTALAYREQTLVVGAAIRAGDWLGLGASLGVTRARATERRHIWAGIAERELVGAPVRDIAVTTSGSGVALVAAGGALIAPPSLPVELAASVRITSGPRVRGSAAASRIGDPADRPPFPDLVVDAPEARAELPPVLVARAGARYLGERWIVEVDGDLTAPLDDAGTWRVTGIRVTDDTGAVAEVDTLPLLLDRQTHGAVRIAADVEVVPGFLWLTAGYAYRTRATPLRRTTPAFADLGGHTVAAGAEVYGNGVVLSIGYAHTAPTDRTVRGTDLRSINPFDAGTEAIGLGTYEGGHNAVGVALEIAWE